MTAINDFLQAMVSAGLAMHKPGIRDDGALHRYRVDGDKPSSTNGWYVLHTDSRPFGAFGSWKTGQSETWTAGDHATLTDGERREIARRAALARAARDIEQREVYDAAAKRAARLWERAGPAADDHPYLMRKRVRSFGLRALRGQLVIPMRNADGELCSLQFIGVDGGKVFLTGGRKRGCYHAIGRLSEALCIAEGYATAASIYMATGYATAVAFDAGNLEPVAMAIRSKFPRLKLVICADDDVETDGNPGLTAATKAARAVGAALAVPRFDGVVHG